MMQRKKDNIIQKFLNTVFAILLALSLPCSASALPGFIGPPEMDVAGIKITAMDNLVDGVTNMADKINKASKEMMKIGDMLICNSLHGEAADVKLEVAGISIAKFKFISFDIFISGCVLYVLGFFIAVIASFYMFDVAFNLSLSIVLLPIALALWPFAWTRGKLKTVVESIAYYTGLFIFLPLGILIGAQLVVTIIEGAFTNSEGSPIDIMTVFNEDKSDIIRDNLGVFTLTFLKVLVSYLVAMRIIPLMANEFCSHFFGGSLVGSPMSEKMTQAIAVANQKTIGKAAKFGKDVASHKIGKAIKKQETSEIPNMEEASSGALWPVTANKWPKQKNKGTDNA